MAAKKKHEWEQVATDLQRTLQQDSEVVSEELFGQLQPDAERQPEQEYQATVRAGYMRGDRTYLQQLATANPAAFLKAFKAIGGVLPSEDTFPAGPGARVNGEVLPPEEGRP